MPNQNPYQEILERKRAWENHPNKNKTQKWAHQSAQQYYDMIGQNEAEQVTRMNASELNKYIQNRQRQAPDQIDFDKYKTETATIDDLKNKWGFDYSRDYANQIAEAQAQAKKDAAENKQQQITNNVQNAVEGTNEDFFQQFLQQQQGQVNNGLNAGIAANQNLRLQMAQNDALSGVYATAQENRMAVQDALARIEQEKIAQANQIYNSRLQQGFENSLNLTQLNQQDNLARLQAALQQRGQNMDWAQFLRELDFEQGKARGNVVGQQAQGYLQAVIDAKQAWAAADTEAEQKAAHERAVDAREQLALLGYNVGDIAANDTLKEAMGALPEIGQTIDARQVEQQAAQFAERLGFDREKFNNLSAAQQAQLAEEARQFDITNDLNEDKLGLARDRLQEEKRQFDNELGWRKHEFSNMSAYEQARMEQNAEQFGEEMAWRMYEMKQTMNYYNSGFRGSGKGGGSGLPTINSGDRGSAVEKLQEKLGIQSDGIFGPHTREAVKQFQRSHGLTVDGIVGQATWDALGLKGSGVSAGGGGSVGGYGNPPESYQRDLAEAVRRAGIPTSQLQAFNWIISHESSFNPKADNPTSTAYGYGQFLDSTRAAYRRKMGMPYIGHPVNQLIMTYQYMVDRYGSPQGAVDFWKANHWY